MQLNGRRSSPAHASMSFDLILLCICVHLLLYTFKHLPCHLIIFFLFSSPFVSLFIFIYNIYIYVYIHIYTATSIFFFVCLSFLYLSCVVCALEHILYSVRAPGVFASSFLMYMPAKIAYISLIFH